MRAQEYRLSVYDPNGKHLCTLFDSNVAQIGNAYNIKITKDINGWNEVEFTIDQFDSHGEENFRCEFLNNENLLYLYEDDRLDIYCIKTPSRLHDKSQLNITCKCNHISEELKARNLYKYFDDLNGIGTCQELMERALRGSGWELGECATFYEAKLDPGDEDKEKVRTYTCQTKTGAYNMISGICKLFNARPVFHGDGRTVDIFSNDDTNGFTEICFGRNMDKITRTTNSENLVTRLYVEGEYGDYGYVGIDSANPTGLPFILNFDHYKDTGRFTEEHQEAVDTYLVDYKAIVDAISETVSDQLQKTSRLFELIGGTGYVRYEIINGEVDVNTKIAGNDISDEDCELHRKTEDKDGDRIILVSADGSYEYSEYTSPYISTGAKYLLKFIPGMSGLIAVNEDMKEASTTMLNQSLKNLKRFMKKDDPITYEQLDGIYGGLVPNRDLSKLKDDGIDIEHAEIDEEWKSDTVIDYVVTIGQAHNSINEYESKKRQMMLELMDLIVDLKNIIGDIEDLKNQQDTIEDTFVSAIGSMLRDGYWSDTNYAPGQEASLYRDAMDISKKMAYPIVSYSISAQNIWGDFDLAQAMRIYDEDARINDYGVITKTTEYVDKPQSDTYAIDSDLLDVGSKTFASILERATLMAEQVRQNREKYERAANISADGKFRTDMLNGAIDVMKNQILSTASSWMTDENGNIIMTALDGLSAMMLSGSGFMIANSKDENDQWIWRTFGTGNGFAADMITTGFLSADRIEANSIRANQLSSDVGENLDLSSNKTVMITGGEQVTAAAANAIVEIAEDKITSTVFGDDQFTTVKQDSEKVEWILKSNASQTDVQFTDRAIGFISDNITMKADKISAIADNIEFSAAAKIFATVFDPTSSAPEGSVSKYLQEAGKVSWIVTGNSQSELAITDGAMNFISDNINIQASKINAVADQINLQSNNSVKNIVGDQIRKSGLINDNIYIGSKNFSGSKWAEVWPDMLTTLPDDGTYNGFAVKKITYVNTPLSQYHPLESRTTYTYSAYVKRTADAQVKFFAGETDKFNVDITDQIGTDWSRFAITFTANEVNDNLFTGTQNFDGDRWKWIVGGWGDITGRTDIDSSFRVKGASGYACTPTQEIMAYAGEVYTLSMYIARSADAQLMFVCENTPDVGKDLTPYVTDAMQRINITFTVNQDGIIRPRIDNGNHDGGAMHIAAIKLERGNHMTRWTAAPEDLNKNIDYNHMSTRVLKTSDAGTIWLCGIKLEKGDIATDWSPSPDDATYTGNEPPLNPYVGKLWLDTSSTPNQLKTYDGQSWNLVGDFDMIWNSYADMQRIQDNLKNEQDKYAKVFDFKQDGLHIHPLVDAGETYESETIMTDKAFDIKVSGTLAAEFAADNVRLGGNSFVRMVPGYFILGG